LIPSTLASTTILTMTEWEMTETIKKAKVKKLATDNQSKELSDRDAKIAERAFYKAEQREFAPGHELNDWFAAEREFLQEENRGLGAT
jgi:hypothetical protein